MSTHDADLVRVEALGDVQRLGQGGDHPAVGGVDRVHRLDAQRHPELAGRTAPAARWPGPPGRRAADQIPVAGRQPAGHQHQRRRPQRRGLLQRLAGCSASAACASAGIGGGEEPAAAQRGDPQTGLGDQPARPRPGPPRRAARARRRSRRARRRRSPATASGSDQRGGGPLVERAAGCQLARPAVAVIERHAGRGAAGCPRRCAASSGSVSSRAALASSNTRARCTTDRADCRPPTMTNPSWCPFSQARKAIPVL